jgi:hypothetical protein
VQPKFTAPSHRRQAPNTHLVEPDWLAMLAAEPRLLTLAKATAAAGRYAPDRRQAWIAIRDQLRDLCGWFAPDERLNSSAHWAVAANRLRHLLRTGGRR